MDLRLALLVGAGGFIGAILRFGVGGLLSEPRFPYGTLAVNIVGSFLLGVIMFSSLSKLELSTEWRMFLGVGIMGAFTTMSAFSFEVFTILEEWQALKAGTYIMATVFLCVLAVYLGKLFNTAVLVKIM